MVKQLLNFHMKLLEATIFNSSLKSASFLAAINPLITPRNGKGLITWGSDNPKFTH